MENQGIVAFSVCASFLDPPLSNGLRGNGPQIRHFFKNLVKFYLSDCTELKIRASGACPNVKLWSAMRLTPGKEAQAGAPHFGSNHKNIFSSQTTWRFERNLVWGQGNGVLLDSMWIRPCEAAGVQWTPKFGIFLKNLLVTHYQTECAETNIGNSGTCFNAEFWLTLRLPRVRGAKAGLFSGNGQSFPLKSPCVGIILVWGIWPMIPSWLCSPSVHRL